MLFGYHSKFKANIFFLWAHTAFFAKKWLPSYGLFDGCFATWETVVILELILFLLSSYCLHSTKWFTPYGLFDGCFATRTSVVILEVIFSFPKHLLPSSPKIITLFIWWLFWYLDNRSNFWYMWDSSIVPEERKVWNGLLKFRIFGIVIFGICGTRTSYLKIGKFGMVC